MTDKTMAELPDGRTFLYTEELGLSLMQCRETGTRLCLEKETWVALVASIRRGDHPGVVRL